MRAGRFTRLEHIRVPVTLGARQSDTEMVEITGGIAAGDVLIVGSAKNVTAGTAVTVLK